MNTEKHGTIAFSVILSLFSVILWLNAVASAHAQSSVRSDNFEIQLPNLNSGAGIPSSDNYNLGSTIGQTAPGLFSSAGYYVRSGFQYVHTIIPFSFSVSDISIDFGTLTVGVGTTQASTLTVKAGGAGGYTVTAQENNPMQNSVGSFIADTLCDSGPCSETSAEPWTQNTTYGFGFNMTGDDVPADFSGTKYRQFADASLPESPAVIMTKNQVTWDYPDNSWPWESSATVTYKVNISQTQAGGTYQNIITYTAIPSF